MIVLSGWTLSPIVENGVSLTIMERAKVTITLQDMDNLFVTHRIDGSKVICAKLEREYFSSCCGYWLKSSLLACLLIKCSFKCELPTLIQRIIVLSP